MANLSPILPVSFSVPSPILPFSFSAPSPILPVSKYTDILQKFVILPARSKKSMQEIIEDFQGDFPTIADLRSYIGGGRRRLKKNKVNLKMEKEQKRKQEELEKEQKRKQEEMEKEQELELGQELELVLEVEQGSLVELKWCSLVELGLVL